MSVTINAHQLGRLIDKTINHMGNEYIPALHGIRLDVDSRYLYAVATDRYTFAVARYGLNHGDCDQEPFAALLPAENVETVREWLRAMKGANWITLSLTEHPIDHEGARRHLLVFESARTTLNVAVSLGQEYPDWRGILRKLTENSIEGEPFPCLNSSYLARFDSGAILRVRLAADEKAALLFGENFIGAMMPARYAGLGPAEQESYATAFNAWQWTLAAGSKDADMNGAAYEEDRPLYDVTTDIRETGETLLQQALQSGWDMRGKSKEKPEEFLAHCLAAVNGWMAFRYLDALHNVDPRAAQAVVAEVADELDSGEIGEFAWDAAEKAGFAPQKWHDAYEAHLKKLAEKRAAETAEPAA